MEPILHQIIENALKHVKNDYQSQVDPENSLISRVFKGLSHYKKDYVKEAVDLFTREEGHPRKIESRLFFDAERSNIPTIHITMPSDQPGENSIGVGESGFADSFIETSTTLTPMYERRFDTQFQIICTSDNHSEVLIMYHLLRVVLISIFDTISLSGLENAKISGQELRIKSDLVPEHIFMRGIGIACSYEIQVPRWWDAQKIVDIFLCSIEDGAGGKMINENQ
jgi:hypothetical protein